MKRASIAVLCIALSSLAASAQELREGLLVHPEQNVAYVMTPQGGIAAIDLATGAQRWTTTAAAKPLALVGNRLVSQLEPKTAEDRDDLQLAALNVQQRGSVVVRSEADLPDTVRVAATQTLEGRFSARAEPAGVNAAAVTWSFVPAPNPFRGMPPDPREPRRSGTGPLADAAPDATSGTLRMNLDTGAIGSAPGPLAEAATRTQEWVIPASEIDASAATQYESADGKHVLTSERVADDRTWEKYRWIVSEAGSGRKVGDIQMHVAFSPFVVRGNTIIFETTPYVLRGDEQEEPAKLRAFDLATGREVWSVEVREVVYRGPMPP